MSRDHKTCLAITRHVVRAHRQSDSCAGVWGRQPPGKQGGLGGRQAPQLSETRVTVTLSGGGGGGIWDIWEAMVVFSIHRLTPPNAAAAAISVQRGSTPPCSSSERSAWGGRPPLQLQQQPILGGSTPLCNIHHTIFSNRHINY